MLQKNKSTKSKKSIGSPTVNRSGNSTNKNSTQSSQKCIHQAPLTLQNISKENKELFVALSQFNFIPKDKEYIGNTALDIIDKLQENTQKIVNNVTEIAMRIYEPFLKKYENQIRYYIKLCNQLKLQKESLESKLIVLLIKEKEYEKIKKDKNIRVENGEIICNDNKDNEIIILRAENSNLKKQIAKYEKKMKRSEKREIILFQEIENENKKLKMEIELLNKNFPISHRGGIHSSSCTTFIGSESTKNNCFTNNNKKTKHHSNNNNTDEDTTNTEGYSNRYMNKRDLLSNKIVLSPYKPLLNSFSSLNHHSNSKKQNNSISIHSNINNSNNKTNSNLHQKTKSAKGTILNNRKSCNINSIKNLFVTTNSMINNFLSYKKNNTRKNSGSKKVFSLNNNNININLNNVNNIHVNINKSVGSGRKSYKNLSTFNKAESARFSNKAK